MRWKIIFLKDFLTKTFVRRSLRATNARDVTCKSRISYLSQVPTSHQARLFSFMNPLAIEIWLYVLAAYVLVSVTMFVVARFSPYEWNNPHPCHAGPEVVENQFSLSNSFWFTIGTLMQQGSDLNPKVCLIRPPVRFFEYSFRRKRASASIFFAPDIGARKLR